jgi:predicted NUDIX family NTP pyrophosphohydrolase
MDDLEVRRYTAAGGVVVHDGHVLVLVRRGRGEVRLPKGHVEPGEEVQAAALREAAARRARRAVFPHGAGGRFGCPCWRGGSVRARVAHLGTGAGGADL